jgi:hypothetical protein
MFASLAISGIAFVRLLVRDVHVHDAAPRSQWVSYEALRELLRRDRTFYLLLLLAYFAILASIARLFDAEPIAAPFAILVLWTLPLPLLVVPRIWRAHRALSGDRASVNGDVVFIWSGQRLRAWLHVRSARLAARMLPRARVKR